MGDNERNDPVSAADGPPRRRFWISFLLTGLSAVGLLGVGFLFRDRLSYLWRDQNDLGNRLPAGVLADYVPEDSQAVLAVNVRQMQEAPAGRKYLAPVLQHFIQHSSERLYWMDLLGINPLGDLDTLLISFAPSSGGEPLWLIRCRLDRSRFQTGPDKLQEANLDGFHVWQYIDRRERRTTIVAPVGDMLVVSESRDRMRTALKQARNPRPVAMREAALRELLMKVDRQKTVWLAAALKDLRSINEIDDNWLKLLLRPLLAHAESVSGEILCAEDVRAELHFQSATEEEAAQLERSLKNICNLAREGGALLVRQKELRPLLRLLGTGDIHRDGTQILLRCRLAADQQEK